VVVGDEVVLVEDWPQQFPSHSIGSLEFGTDGALYATAGDGASFKFTDYGQSGNPANSFGEPPGVVGTPLSAPTAAGGALRSQNPRRGGPVVPNGTVLRIDPDTGAARLGNPMYGDADPSRDRVVAFGLRNPFRMTVRPGTNELWIGGRGSVHARSGTGATGEPPARFAHSRRVRGWATLVFGDPAVAG